MIDKVVKQHKNELTPEQVNLIRINGKSIIILKGNDNNNIEERDKPKITCNKNY